MGCQEGVHNRVACCGDCEGHAHADTERLDTLAAVQRGIHVAQDLQWVEVCLISVSQQELLQTLKHVCCRRRALDGHVMIVPNVIQWHRGLQR